MKYYYIAKDFLMTRNGKFLALAIATAFAAIFVSNYLKEQKAETAIAPSPPSSIWQDDDEKLHTPLQQTEKNKSFEAFTPITSKPEKVIVQPQPKPQRLPVIESKEINQQIAPLINAERKASKPSIVKATKPPALPELEPGAVIHCQLLTPATTDHANLPVIAQITRPVIRNGITLVPKGVKITGTIQTSKNKRVFFALNWQAYLGRNRSLNLSAHVQEKSHDPHTGIYNLADGRTGLPGFIKNEAKPKRSKILGKIAKGIARLGKETVRTAAGEYIPSTGKNAAINIGPTVVDGLLPKPKQQVIKQEPYIHVPAGRAFYLVITSTRRSQGSHQSQETSIDQLWADVMRKRLSQQSK